MKLNDIMILYLLLMFFMVPTAEAKIENLEERVTKLEEQVAIVHNMLSNNSSVVSLDDLLLQSQVVPSMPNQEYEKAFSLLKENDWRKERAELLLSNFVKHYPDHPLSVSAKYWLGEIYWSRALYLQAEMKSGSFSSLTPSEQDAMSELMYANYRASATNYIDAYQSDRYGTKAQVSLYKLSLALHRLGENKSSCDVLKKIEEYTDTSKALLYDIKKQKRKVCV